MINRTNLENVIYTAIVLVCGLFFLFCLMALGGCCKTPETIIKERTITVTPPAIHDTVMAVEFDTVVIGNKLALHDTVATIKYYPVRKYFEYKIKPDTVRLSYQDTLYQTKIIEKKIETPLLSKIGLIALGAIAGVVAYIFIKQNL